MARQRRGGVGGVEAARRWLDVARVELVRRRRLRRLDVSVDLYNVISLDVLVVGRWVAGRGTCHCAIILDPLRASCDSGVSISVPQHTGE